MSDRYKLVPPGGGESISFTIESGASVAEAYASVAELLGRDLTSFSLLLRNPPGSALPFFHLRPADDVLLRRSAPPGSVLVVEAEQSTVEGDRDRDRDRSEGEHRPWPASSDLAATEDLITDAILRSSTEVQSQPQPQSQSQSQSQGLEEESAAGLLVAGAGSGEAGTGLMGVSNLGNTCYLASAVQCLSHTSSLCPKLKESQSVKGVSGACGDLLRTLWSSESAPAPAAQSAAPRQLKAAIAEHARIFAGYEQQDAQELLQVLLECLHTELKRSCSDKDREGETSSDLPKEEALLADALWSRAQRQDASVVSDTFQGQLRSCTRCPRCEREESIFETFWSLPLPLPASSGGNQVWIDEALGNFCSEEPLDESWMCEGCKEHTKGTKRTRLWRAPRVLQLHLKRFDWHSDSPATPSVSSSSALPPPPPASGVDPPKTKLQRVDEHGAPTQQPEQPVSMVVDNPTTTAAEDRSTEGPLPTLEPSKPHDLADGDTDKEKKPLPPVHPETALRDIARCLDFDDQARMYELVGLFLLNIKKSPKEGKFRSIKKAGSRIRRDLLDLHGGEALMLWAGFRDEGERFEAPKEMTSDSVEAKYEELSRHSERERMQHLRRLDRLRVERNRQLALPHGDGGPPLRRWGGRLPSFGRGAAGFHGVRCVKVEASLAHRADASSPNGFASLSVIDYFATGSPEDVESVSYRLVGVIHHLGATPFSGHYIAYCWSEATGSWWKFNDGSVTKCNKDHVYSEVLGTGAYVLFLERE